MRFANVYVGDDGKFYARIPGGPNGLEEVLSGQSGSLPNIPVYKTTLSASQTIAAGERADLYGPITIPNGVLLTVNGFLKVRSDTYQKV